MANLAHGSHTLKMHDLRTHRARVSSRASSKDVRPMNAVNFPSSPTYAVINEYSDSTCSTLLESRSAVLDTCLTSPSGSAKFSCGKISHTG
jgi:hypothetical protein